MKFYLKLFFVPSILLIFQTYNDILAFSDTHFGPRPDSKPFISGDSFRALADHIFDETTTTFNPNVVSWGDIIFVNLSHLEQFFTTIHPHIKYSYILISHNHDYSAPGKFKYILKDPKILLWFTQNPDIANHPKLIGIPIGLSNKHWPHAQTHPDAITYVQHLIPFDIQKRYLLYVNFHINTNPSVRQPVYDYFSSQPFSIVMTNRVYKDYLQDLTISKFVVSPHGNGLDCHRTWEALYMGSFPVVKSSTLDPLYQDLPVLVVKEWTDITKKFLEEQYPIFRAKKYNYNRLYFKYWEDLIKQAQATIRKNRLYFNKKDIQ